MGWGFLNIGATTMTPTMVKRVAEGVFGAWRKHMDARGNVSGPRKFSDLGPPATEFAMLSARAALEAMREPTEPMLKAFYGNMPVEQRLGNDWRDMIDTALKD